MSFNIQSFMNPDYVVGIDANHGLVLQWFDFGNPGQLFDTTDQSPNGFHLRNVATGKYVTSYGYGNQLMLTHAGDIFQQKGNAIRLANNIDWNMNELGNTPTIGTPIGLYKWDGGGPNEMWNLVLLSMPVVSTVMIASKITEPRSESPVFLTCTPGGMAVHGAKPAFKPAQTFRMTRWHSGAVSLVGINDSLLFYLGDDLPVGQRPAQQMNIEALWNPLGAGGFDAIQVNMNKDQNLNVFGGSTGNASTVGTWSWSGGAPNEVWQIVHIPPQ